MKVEKTKTKKQIRIERIEANISKFDELQAKIKSILNGSIDMKALQSAGASQSICIKRALELLGEKSQLKRPIKSVILTLAWAIERVEISLRPDEEWQDIWKEMVGKK